MTGRAFWGPFTNTFIFKSMPLLFRKIMYAASPTALCLWIILPHIERSVNCLLSQAGRCARGARFGEFLCPPPVGRGTQMVLSLVGTIPDAPRGLQKAEEWSMIGKTKKAGRLLGCFSVWQGGPVRLRVFRRGPGYLGPRWFWRRAGFG